MAKKYLHAFTFFSLLLNIFIGYSYASYLNDKIKKSYCKNCNDKISYSRYSSFLQHDEKKKRDTTAMLGKHTQNSEPDGNENDLKHSQKRENKKGEVAKSFLHLNNKEEKTFYSLKLNENNLRWSIPFLIGFKQTKVDLGIVTSSLITALYCSYNVREDDELKNLKYDIEKSKDLKYIECKSKYCLAINTESTCTPLKNFFQNLHDYNIKKRSCKKRFCDYVNNTNFLNMNNRLNDRDVSVCSFNTTIGSDQVKGFYFKDSFYLGDIVKGNYEYFGCISEGNDLKFNEVISGFIGLADDKREIVDPKKNKFPSILDMYILKSTSKKNIFALCFIEKGGIATFGGYEKSLLKKQLEVSLLQVQSKEFIADEALQMDVDAAAENYQIVWIKYSDAKKSSYNLFLKEIRAKSWSKNDTYEIGADALVDSYNYFLSLPVDITTKLKTFIFNNCPKTDSDCTKLIENGVMEIKSKDISKFPTIELIFNEGKVVVHPKDYIIDEGEGKYRVLINSSGVVKLGIPFFLNKYLIFDNENGKLGYTFLQACTCVGPSECSLNIDEKDISGMDISLPGIEYPDQVEYEGSGEAGFFEKNKTAIIAFSAVTFVTSIVGSIFYFL
ncbi:aspartyl protease, putative [Plasmodium malariae]|uniref:Aspartyl protease, putative n=1 Tax=Plasmodium malariae TaxID=5858 RepID=A0A1A8X5W4_PLAMA|nr:aspartyl protease, putative [Plasmodium malariae]